MAKRLIINIDESLCNGCGECVPGCAEGALEIIGGKAKLVAEKYCDGLGACLGECPTGALTLEEREADAFDEAAVEELLKTKTVVESLEKPTEKTLGCGCPSSAAVTFQPAAQQPAEGEDRASALSHWPVKLKLVNAESPFLKGADLLLAADCAPAAYPGYHDRFLPGRAVMIGCPKFDDEAMYVEKLTDIFRNAGLKSVTILEMEVPCCSNFSRIIERAYSASEVDLPIETVVVTRDGRILERKNWMEMEASLPMMS